MCTLSRSHQFVLLCHLFSLWLNYSWTINNMGFSWAGTLYRNLHRCFFPNKYTVGSPCLWDLHMQIQPTANEKQYFGSVVENLQMWRADYVHCSTPSYRRDSSVPPVLSTWGPGTYLPWLPGTITFKVLKNQKFMHIFPCTGKRWGQTHIVQGSTVT